LPAASREVQAQTYESDLVLSLLKEIRTRVEDPDLSGVVWGLGELAD